MLACSEDIYFNDESNNTSSTNNTEQLQKEKRSRQIKHSSTQIHLPLQRSSNLINNQQQDNSTNRDKEEVVIQIQISCFFIDIYFTIAASMAARC